MTRASIHFICGSTGAGKTTYAIRLCDDLGAVRFSIDEWMTALFWMDAPQPTDPAWAIERVERCRDHIWRTALEVAGRGAPCVLEIGLVSAAIRARYAVLAREAGLPAQLHYLDVPADERWRRVHARNSREDAAQLSFPVTREMFDFVEIMWEPPTLDELAAANGVRVAF